MEYRRRGRRARRQYDECSAPSYFGVKTLVFIAGVACLAFLTMQYNCSQCNSQQELSKLVSSVDGIAKHLNTMNNNYQRLESKVSVYSRELPKLEEQMVALEALAQAIEATRNLPSLPYVDVTMNLKPIEYIPIKNDTKERNQTQSVQTRVLKYTE